MPRDIDGLVIHRCETGRTGDEVKVAEAKTGLGYHYFIGPDGTCYQLYQDGDTVWHARNWSKYTLGIAVYGDFHPPDRSRNDKVTAAQYHSLVTLCQRLVLKYGYLFIMGHTDLANASKHPDKVCPGHNLDVHRLARTVYLKDIASPEHSV